MSSTKLDTPDAIRKRKLIAEGEFFRVGILHAKTHVGQALRPEMLLRGAAEHALGFANGRLNNFMASPVAGVRTIMPYVLTTVSFINRKKLIKPALAAVVVVAGAAVWFLRRHRDAQG